MAIMMATSGKTSSVTDRFPRHRNPIHGERLRSVLLRIPDTRSPEFADEAHRQSGAVAASLQAGDDQAFVDALSVEVD